MTKAEKKIVNVVKNTVIGGIAGAAFGAIMTPVHGALALTAPISFPIVGGALGAIHNEMPNRFASTLFGVGIGVCLIPSAPITLALLPIATPCWAVTGAVAGAAVGLVQNDKEKK